MRGNITITDRIGILRSYLTNFRMVAHDLGVPAATKVLFLRIGAINDINLSFKGKERHITRESFAAFWQNEVCAEQPIDSRIKVSNMLITFIYKGKKLLFSTDSKNKKLQNETIRLIGELFFASCYDINVNDIKDKQVVDIGANVGDTPIYFAINGASHVYAYEPYRYVYNIAKRNIAMNGLSKKISLSNSAVGAKNKTIIVDDKLKSGVGEKLESSATGKKVRMETLKDIVEGNNISCGILKCDCEGGEYDIFLNADDKTLLAFDVILMEYHYGYINLENRLKCAGFRVSHTRPTKMQHADSSKIPYDVGMINAVRI